jgi:hypothetical protein
LDDIEYFYARQAIGRIVAHLWRCVMGSIYKGGLPHSGYTKLPNELIRNLSIGDGTFRFIAWVHSHVDGFHISFASVKVHLGYGRDKLRAILTEAEKNDYLVRLKIQDKKGRYDWDYYVFTETEECKSFKAIRGISPGTVYPEVVCPGVDNPSVVEPVDGLSVGGNEPPHKKNIIPKEQKEKEQEEEAPLALVELNSIKSNSKSIASLITKTESSGKQITPHGDGCSARPLQSIYAQAANVWELVDLCLDSPDLADAKPPSELLAVYNEKYKWSQWRWPWRSLTKTKEFGTFNPEVVKKLATQLAVKDKATPAQKYDWAIATINLWEQTKGGWTNLMTYCDRPVDQVSMESAEELAETPRYIKGWHDSYHEILHEKFRAARSLEVFFAKDKDNKPWYEFAKEKFPSWDWSK